MLYLDLETRSAANLKDCGAYEYAAHPTTEILIAAWATGLDQPIRCAYGGEYEVGIDLFIQALREADLIVAHNAAFERLILARCFPDLKFPPERFVCTAAMARENGLPGSLEDAARAMQVLAGDNIPQKDHRGATYIRKFCIPDADGDFASLEGPDFDDFKRYCMRDVEAMMGIVAKLPEYENHEDYVINEHINDVGIGVDREVAKAAMQYMTEEVKTYEARIKKLTDGVVTKSRGVKLTQWVYDNLPSQYKPMLLTADGRLTLDKNIRKRLMDMQNVLSFTVSEVLRCAEGVSASSAAKYKTMYARSATDGRVRGSYMFWGAAASSRFSARGLQMQNMPRDVYSSDDAENLKWELETGWRRGDAIAPVLRKLLRSTIVASPGHTFVGADWGQIEGRITPWLAFEEDTEAAYSYAVEKLAQYADDSRDVYCETASRILGKEVGRKDPERQSHGKVPELSLGFAGGPNALMSMAKVYQVGFDVAEAERIVRQWRALNPWAEMLWNRTEQAAIAAVRAPGYSTRAGKITYCYSFSALGGGGALYAALPFGVKLTYPNPQFIDGELTYMRGSWLPKSDEKEWPRTRLWRGLLVENAVQATAAGMLRLALCKLHYNAAPIVGHTHDEIILECPEADAEYWEQMLENAMLELQRVLLPLSVETWSGPTYAHGKV